MTDERHWWLCATCWQRGDEKVSVFSMEFIANSAAQHKRAHPEHAVRLRHGGGPTGELTLERAEQIISGEWKPKRKQS